MKPFLKANQIKHLLRRRPHPPLRSASASPSTWGRAPPATGRRAPGGHTSGLPRTQVSEPITRRGAGPPREAQGAGGIWLPWERQVTTEAPRDGDRTCRHTVLTEPPQNQVPHQKRRHRRSPEGWTRMATAALPKQAQTESNRITKSRMVYKATAFT